MFIPARRTAFHPSLTSVATPLPFTASSVPPARNSGAANAASRSTGAHGACGDDVRPQFRGGELIRPGAAGFHAVQSEVTTHLIEERNPPLHGLDERDAQIGPGDSEHDPRKPGS